MTFLFMKAFSSFLFVCNHRITFNVVNDFCIHFCFANEKGGLETALLSPLVRTLISAQNERFVGFARSIACCNEEPDAAYVLKGCLSDHCVGDRNPIRQAHQQERAFLIARKLLRAVFRSHCKDESPAALLLVAEGIAPIVFDHDLQMLIYEPVLMEVHCNVLGNHFAVKCHPRDVRFGFWYLEEHVPSPCAE